MKQVTKVYDVYNYDELSEKAKDKVREEMKDAIIDGRFEWLHSDLAESLQACYGIDGVVRYSLSYSQGDGLHFNSENLMTKQFYDLMVKVVDDKVNDIKDKEVVKQVIKVFYDHRSNLQVSARHDHRNRYEYASKHDINIEVLDEDAFEDLKDVTGLKNFAKGVDVVNIFEVALNLFNNIVFLTYLKICNDFEAIGYKVYEVSEEDIKDLIESNDYVFLEDGDIF